MTKSDHRCFKMIEEYRTVDISLVGFRGDGGIDRKSRSLEG